jgi:hypothetical protein
MGVVVVGRVARQINPPLPIRSCGNPNGLPPSHPSTTIIPTYTIFTVGSLVFVMNIDEIRFT